MKIRELSDEVEYVKMLGDKSKNQGEDAKNKLKIYQEENMKLSETRKIYEEKINSNLLIINSQRNIIKEKDNQIKFLQEESKNFEGFQVEKPKMEKKIADFSKQITAFKEGLEYFSINLGVRTKELRI